MTMPANAQKFPFPVLKMMFTDNVIPDGSPKEAILWQTDGPHPYAPHMRIRRMFADRGGVEVYAATEDGRACTRDIIPMKRVRIIQEWMDPNIFIEELRAAEYEAAPVGPLSVEDTGADDEPDPEPGTGEPDLDEPDLQNSDPANVS